MKYYHVITTADKEFRSADEAVRYFSTTPLEPRIPTHVADGEDTRVPRICVAPSVEICFTAIGLIGAFRRCCAINQDAFDYSTEVLEVYPVIICEFDNIDPYRPSVEEVPDVGLTREGWLFEPTLPDRVYVKWLYPHSIRWNKKALKDRKWVCKSIEFVEPHVLNKHPWLNGFGNVLDSSEEEPTWRQVESASWYIAYLKDGRVILDGGILYTDLNEAFDVYQRRWRMQPRRYIIPSCLLREGEYDTSEEGYDTQRISAMSLE